MGIALSDLWWRAAEEVLVNRPLGLGSEDLLAEVGGVDNSEPLRHKDAQIASSDGGTRDEKQPRKTDQKIG
jgi:hypothetical protein